MYQNCYYDKSTRLIHVWDDEKGYYTKPYRNYGYMTDPEGTHTAIDGNRVSRVTSWTKTNEELGMMYESDVDPEMRTLIDLYYQEDRVSNGHRVLFFDIEVDTTEKYPDLQLADNAITAISWYERNSDQYAVYILDPDKAIPNEQKQNVYISSFATEAEMLKQFILDYERIAPTILTGWNIDGFDIPYLVNRLKAVFSEAVSDRLSPIRKINLIESSNIYKLAGVSCLDYMALYKKFTANEDASYALNAIAKKELGKTKIAYDGTLNDLYRNDIKKFIDYNLTDVVLVKELDDKLKYVDLVRNICHKGNVPYNAIYMPSKYLEGAALTYMKRNGIVANNIQRSAYETAENEGAFVKVPIRGRHEWIYSIDLQSLYPSLIMTLNISPETKIAKIRNWSKVNFMFKLLNPSQTIPDDTEVVMDTTDNNSLVRMKLSELKVWLRDNKFTVASNGVVYRTDRKGLLPSILELWFEERVQYKNKMKEFERAGDKEQAAYYDQRQYVQKIMLNSFYGVLGARGFRFRDNDNAEAITLSGQDVIQFTNEIVNRYYEKRFGAVGDQAIYADTDSLYIQAVPGIKGFEGLTTEERISAIRDLAEEVTDFVNNKLIGFASHHMNSDYCKLLFKQEALASACFFVAKKRYAYKKVYDLEVNKPANKLVVKGLDVVRSNFPPLFRTFMSQVLDKLLMGTDRTEIDAMCVEIKQQMLTADVLDILKPTGVNELGKWAVSDLEFKKGTPVHVKAALCYNFLLKKFKLDKRCPPIIEGEKVKWAYLKQNFYGIDALAIKGYDDPKQIIQFISENVDYDDIYESNLQRKLQDFYDAMDWGLTDANNNIENFFKW